MQTGGSSDAEEVSPGARDNASAHIDDPTADAGDEGIGKEAGQERRPERPKDKVQPSLKALAKHRRQRLRELQAEQELEANLGTSTGERAASRHPPAVSFKDDSVDTAA